MVYLPPFLLFPELRSSRVLLRELKLSDTEFVREIMYYNGRQATDRSDAIRMMERIDGDYRSGNTVNWVIVDTQTLQPVGTIGYYRGFSESTGEIGFILKPGDRGKGYMSEALRLVTAFGKEAMQLERVIAITRPGNNEAIRLLERCHFRYLGPFETEYIEFEYA
jgi:ribosomal-protein-alanine N-acetyltransferase